MNKYEKDGFTKNRASSKTITEKKKNSNTPKFLSYPYFNIFSFLIIAFTAFLVYSNSLEVPFHFDDESSIVSNNQITSLSNFCNKYYWLYYSRPLAIFSFALNYHFNKLDIFGYHLVNLIIHIIASFFVFLLVKLIIDLNNYKHYKLEKYKNWFALFAALLFALHPIQTQAVTYIVQRMASMAGMFYLISIYLYAIGRIEHEQKSKTFKAIVCYLLALTFGLCGIMTKQTAVTFPIAFLLFEFIFIRDKENKIFTRYIVISSFTLLIIFILYFFLNRSTILLALHGTKVNSLDYLITQFVVIIKYLQLIFLPINQCADYGNVNNAFPYINTFWRFDVIGCFLLLIGLFSSAVYLLKINKALSFGILWFFLTLSIESSFIPIADPMFEHRMYLPMAGISIFLICGLTMLLPRLRTTHIFSFLTIVILFLGVACYSRNSVWRSELILWTDVVEKSPNNARAWYNLGVTVKKNKSNEEAIRCFNKAIEINPYYYDALFNKGVTIASLGRQEEAILCYNKIIEISPADYQTWNNKGNALEKLKRYSEAMTSYDKAIEINPMIDLAWYNKGNLLEKLGKYEEAIKYYDKSIELNPGLDLVWYNKGSVLSILGRNEEAIISYDKAIKRKPEYYEAWYNKGIAFSMLQKHEEAIKCFSKVIEIKPDVYVAWNNKGSVLEKLGKYEDAIRCYDKALQIRPNYETALNNKFLAQQKLKLKRTIENK